MSTEFNILVVDDEVLICRYVARIIESLGFNSFIATERQECLKIINQHSPDIIIIDILLGHVNGFDLCGEIKNISTAYNPFVVIYTGMLFSVEEREKGMRVGVDGYLQKGMNEEELKLMLQIFHRTATSESKFRDYIHSAPIGIFILDENMICLEINEAGVNLTQLSLVDLLENSWLKLLYESSQELFLEEINKCKELNKSFSLQTNIKTNAEFQTVWQVSGIHLKNNTFLVFCSDISDKIKADEVLNNKLHELKIFNDAAVDREILINDLRKEVNSLLEQTGKKPKYRIIGN